MNKRAAQQKAREGGISIGELRQMISASRGKGGNSIVNPQFEKEWALDIFEAAINGRDDNEIAVTMKLDPYSPSGKLKATGDCLIIQNILRECT